MGIEQKLNEWALVETKEPAAFIYKKKQILRSLTPISRSRVFLLQMMIRQSNAENIWATEQGNERAIHIGNA